MKNCYFLRKQKGKAAYSSSLMDSIPKSYLDGDQSASAIYLPKRDLAGIIFGCKNITMEECLSKQLFGLPQTHFSYIRNIEEGLPLFLFNYDDRKLYGIFEAASRGRLNPNSYAWTDGSKRTPFSAQVSVRIKIKCQPLNEDQFKQVLEKNHFSHQQFCFELDQSQTRALINLFRPATSSEWTKLIHGITNILAASQATQSKVTSNYGSMLVKSNDIALPLNLMNGNILPLLGQEENTKQEYLTSKGYTHADVCKRDTVSHYNFVEQNNFVSQSWGDECIENGSIGKTPSSGPECLESEEILSDWEEWTQENAQINPSDACDPLNEDSQRYNRVSDNSLEPKEMMPSNLGKLDIGNKYSTSHEQVLTANEHRVSASQSLYENAELQSLIGLCEWKLTMERKQIELNQEIQILRNSLIVKEQKIQHLGNRVKELELKLNSSLAYGDSPNLCAQQSLGSNNNIYLLGGFNGISWLSALDAFSPSLDELTPLRPMNFTRSYASAVVLDDKIFTFGGGDGSSWYDTVECYSRWDDHWTLCAPLIHKKGSLAGATLYGKIYAIGGGDGSGCFSDVEVYDPALGKWIFGPLMLRKRFAPAAAELNGAIYAVGGYGGHDYLKLAERYDPREPHWNKIPSMNTRRGCHTLAVLNEKLYAVGGYDGDRMVSSVEVFDPRMPSWVFIEPMKDIRGYCAAAVLDSTLFLIGGLKDEDTILDTVESYKEGVGWRDTGLKSIGKRCFCSAIVF